jgi:hypothetical protein
VETNLSLVEKMRRDFGLEMPLLEDDDTPENYFEKFTEILKLRKTWSIRRHVTLALLSFGKLLMYRESRSEELARRSEHRQAPAGPRAV